MEVEDMIMILFAGSKGYLDRVEVSKVLAYEKAWLEHVNASHKSFFTDLKANKMTISPELEKKMHQVCDEFTTSFTA
jgi:F-type H+-transporting ATPase subunit alpha